MNRESYNNLRKNQTSIKRGFEKLKSYAVGKDGKGGMARVVMTNIARDGLRALLYEHDLHESNMAHPSEKNTLAYALSHDGVIIESGYHNGGEGDMPGDALSEAIAIASRGKGWMAVVLSELNFGFYNVALEEDLLNAARGDIESAWSNMFGSDYLVPGAVEKPS